MHPWLWLGQNAAAIQALCAVLALCGLIVYAWDTQGIRRDQERTNRAALTPYLALGREEYGGNSDGERVVSLYSRLVVRNIGEGAALNLKAWCREVSEDFHLDQCKWDEDNANKHSTVIEQRQLMKGESCVVATGGYIANLRFLTVVQAEDQRGVVHQFHILTVRDKDTVVRWYSREQGWW